MRSWGRRSTCTCLVSTGDFPQDQRRVSRIIMSPPDPDPAQDWLGPGCVSVSVNNCVNPKYLLQSESPHSVLHFSLHSPTLNIRGS